MDINQAAEQAWDRFVGSGTPAEMMEGFDNPEVAINGYCKDWPFSESGPDQEDLMGYTPRELLIIYLKNHKNEWS